MELTLEDGPNAARLWLAREGKPRGGYEVDGEATEAIVEGLGAAMAALRGDPAAERAR